MARVLIISDKDVSLPFRAMGIETSLVQNAEEGKKALLEAVNKGYGIIFLVESIARDLLNIIDQITENRNLPVITIIPGFGREVSKAAEERLRQLIKKAVGIELPE